MAKGKLNSSLVELFLMKVGRICQLHVLFLQPVHGIVITQTLKKKKFVPLSIDAIETQLTESATSPNYTM